MKPLISVLIDTYNHERYIEQALVSTVEQDFAAADFEIVVVDDGSTDRTPDIVKKFAPRVRLVRKRNGGQASAFNTALPELNGEIVALLDGDDWFAKNKLIRVNRAFEENPDAGGVAHGFYEVDEATGRTTTRAPQSQNFVNLATEAAAREALLWWPFMVVGSLTVRREILRRAVPIAAELVFCADGPIAWSAIAGGVQIFEEPLCYYRRHGSNLHAIAVQNTAKLRRKSEMDSLMQVEIERLLQRLNVNNDALLALHHTWVEQRRAWLRQFGGSRLRTFQTEMWSFNMEHRKPNLSYRLFKYFVTGTATLLLPPPRFYELREWYARHGVTPYGR